MPVNVGAKPVPARRSRRPAPSAPAQPQRQWEQVYAELRRRILNLELSPGTPLSEASVARDLRMSPTPVRDALGRLHQQGLLEVGAGRRYAVARLSVGDVAELAEARFVLESAICRLAIERATPGDMEGARQVARRLEDPGLDQAALIDRNQDFHLAVAMMARNQRLVNALHALMEDSRRVFHLGLGALQVEDMVDAHRRLLDAVAQKDVAAARAVCEEEAFGTSERVVSQLVRGVSAASYHLGAAEASGIVIPPRSQGEGGTK
jgi:DNA-binding GntR family transcriptional regulator